MVAMTTRTGHILGLLSDPTQQIGFTQGAVQKDQSATQSNVSQFYGETDRPQTIMVKFVKL